MSQITTSIKELLTVIDTDQTYSIYSDGAFSRYKMERQLNKSVSVSILQDTLVNDSIDCFYISVHTDCQTEFTILFDQHTIEKFDSGYIAKYKAQDHPLYWMPIAPAARIYDKNKRITKTLNIDSKNETDRISFTCSSSMTTQFCILRFAPHKADGVLPQLTCRDNLETTEFFRIHKNTFHYQYIGDLWMYLIQGRIYKPAKDKESLSIQSQHTAYSLYYHFLFLNKRFKKTIYSSLTEFIAYSVLLSLDADNRWHHGLWSEKMETHCVFQVSGIDILLDYYKRTEKKIFLEKAFAAADWLVEIAEDLSDDMTWFLHDSLELNLPDVRIYYDPLMPSKVFGKSESNTLCLNSHIATMKILHSLKEYDTSGKYDQVLLKANKALKLVLTLKPAELRYRLIYGLRETFYSLAVLLPCSLTKTLRRKYESFLQKGWLLKFKSKHPRFVMPNGYTERDLVHTVIMNDYHLVNMRDMLFLYGTTKEKWFGDIIEKCMHYTVQSPITRYYKNINQKASLYIDILMLYVQFSEKYTHHFSECKHFITGYQSGLAIDPFSNPELTGLPISLSTDNKNIIILSIKTGTNTVAIIVNLSSSNQLFNLKSEQAIFNECFDITDISGKMMFHKQPIEIQKSQVLKIVHKSSTNS